MEFYRRSTAVDAEFEEMSAEGQKTTPLSQAADDNANRKVDNVAETRPYTLMQLFMDADLRSPLFIACALVTIQQFSGINAVRRSLQLLTQTRFSSDILVHSGP